MPQSHGENRDTDDGEASEGSLDSTGKKKSFRRLIKRFAEKTSMQGVAYINNAKLCGAKLIWSILLLIAVGAMSLHLWYLMDQFYSWPINTKIELGYNNLRFPQLTICNTNIMHKGRFNKLENAEELKELVDALNPRNLVPDQFKEDYDPTKDSDDTAPPSGNDENQPPPPSNGGGQPVSTTASSGGGQPVLTTTQTTGSKGEGPLLLTTTKTTGSNGGGPPVLTTTKTTGSNGGGQPVLTTTKTTGSNGGVPPVLTTTETTGSNGGGQPVLTTTKTTSSNGGGQPVLTTTKTTGSNGGGQPVLTTTITTGSNGGGQPVLTTTKNTGSNGGLPVLTTTKTTGSNGGGQPVLTTTKTTGSNEGGQSVPRTTRSTNSGGSGQNAPPPQPGKRRKRYIDNYNNVRPSQYKPDYKDYREDEKLEDFEYNGERSNTAQLQELLTELYMDVNKQRRAQIGHNISDMLLDCSFFGRVCDHRQFRLHQTSKFGNCWTIDSKNFNVQKSGPAGGLSLLLYLETGEYQYGITQGYGIRVQIHEPESIPYPEEEGFFVPASMETSIGLKKIDIVRRGNPYGECNDGVEFQKLYGFRYTRRSCQAMCELTRTIEACGCFGDDSEEISLFRNVTLKSCRKPTEEKCLVDIHRAFDKNEITCDCQNPCAETAYTRSMSSRQWPNDDYALVLLESVCESNVEACRLLRQEVGDQNGLNNNFLRLNIFYEDLNFETITETPEIELAQFMSDVGGAVGLWIGLSILSMCELFQLMVELCDYAVHKTVKERRVDRKRRRKQAAKNEANNSNSDNRSKDSGNSNRTKNNDKLWPNTSFPYENGNAFSGGIVRNLPPRPYDHFDRPQSRADYGIS